MRSQGSCAWLQGALQDLRARLYWGFNEVLTPDVQKLAAACAKPGASLHAPTTLLPTTPRISALLKVLLTLLLGPMARRPAVHAHSTVWTGPRLLMPGTRCNRGATNIVNILLLRARPWL